MARKLWPIAILAGAGAGVCDGSVRSLRCTIGIVQSARSPQPRSGGEFFARPADATQRRYEALRAYLFEGWPAAEVADAFGYTVETLNSMVSDFALWPERVQTKHAGLLLCLPDLVALDLPAIVKAAGYPGTTVIPAVSSILSLLALKLANIRRTSHVEDLATDRGAALFAGLTFAIRSTASRCSLSPTTETSGMRLSFSFRAPR